MKTLTLSIPTLSRLQRLTAPPQTLYYIGEDPTRLLTRPTVAIVGTRKMSAYGTWVTEMLSGELARAGVVVVSGNALGVDVCAQKAALEAGGQVIAVVPSGLDRVYPATNRPVAERIVASGGAIISEYEAGHQPRPEEFLARNRIIAGLSDLVIVTEAAERSGSLNTAQHAREAGIPVFAVPGQINATLSAGTNSLLKSGAHILTDTKDVLDFLGLSATPTQTSLVGDDDLQTEILQLLAQAVHDNTMLQLALKVELADLQTALTMLEINGRIRQNTAGAWELI